MSRFTNSIDGEVFRKIADYLREAGNTAHRGWIQNSEDEDACMGHLGAKLAAEGSFRSFESGDWTWSITSTKFGSRGRGATESIIGADAIVEISVTHAKTGTTQTKGLLLQAKMNGSSQSALSQITTMERVATASCALVDLSINGYRVVDGRDYLRADSHRNALSQRSELLGDFLVDKFMGCTTGIVGLQYNALERKLSIPNTSAGPVRVDAKVKRRFTIAIIQQ